MDLTLVVMAAGLGSRFGGTKQLVAVGPDREAFLDYAISDAAAAGVTRTVIVVRSEIEADVRRHVETRHGHRDVAYVRQDEHGPVRSKPWGTAHAVLTAAAEVAGPFIVCNADDYYGSTSYAALAECAAELGEHEAALAGFMLGQTLPATGTVSRGICTVRDGRLVSVVEHHGIGRTEQGDIVASDPPAELEEESIASMNLWAFPRRIFDRLERDFDAFVSESADDEGAEFLLPSVVTAMMDDGELAVSVVPTAEAWVGITHPGDVDTARARITSSRSR